MIDHSCLPQRPTAAGRWRRAPVLLVVASIMLATGDLAALPVAEPELPPLAVVPVQDGAEGAPEAAAKPSTAFEELNQSLAAARARLEELSKAADLAAAAARLRRELTDVKAENQRLEEQLAAAGESRRRLRESEAKMTSLTEAVEEANQRAQQLEQELASLRWRNAQLGTTLERVQAEREQAEREATEREAATTAKVEALTRSVEQSAGEITSLREELAASQQRVAIATSSRNEAEARLVEMQETLSQETTANERLQRELTEARAEAGAAIDARDRVVAAQTAAESDLRTARAERDELRVTNERLGTEVAALREAADSAAAAARQNLIAVETRIDELDEALALVQLDDPATVAPAAGPTGEPGGEVEVAEVEDPGDRSGAAAGPAAAASAESFGPAPLPPVEAAAATTEATADGDLELIKSASAAAPSVAESLTQLTADLPLEKRLQAQSLMADLDARATDEGLKMIVPGAALFALNSDRIERSAHDTLAKVAELIDVYDQHPILIRGYTDAVGDAGYNLQLSERRASLVKQFFVDNFDIDAARVEIEGRGERQPIATNATLDGRRANRRVEVLILD